METLELRECEAGLPLLNLCWIDTGGDRLGPLLQAAVPHGRQPLTLELGECRLDGLAAVLQTSRAGAAVLAGVRELRVLDCSCGGGMDAPLDALLRLCAASLTRLVFSGSTAHEERRLLQQLPPALAACAQLRDLQLRNGSSATKLQLPSGAYLTGGPCCSAVGWEFLPPMLCRRRRSG